MLVQSMSSLKQVEILYWLFHLRVIALATGSLLCITEKMRRRNSSVLSILSRCFSLCCVTLSTQSL